MSTVTIHVGSNLDVLPYRLSPNSVDAIVTDAPYELGFMGKSWDASGIAYNVELWRQCLRVLKPGGHLLAFSGSRTYHRMTCAIEDAGFEVRDQIMWVYGSGFPKSHNVANDIDKKLGCPPRGRAIPVASTHFPTGKYAEEKLTGNKVEAYEARTEQGKKWEGWGTALKPAHEPIVLARKPLGGTVADNVMKWGTGALNIDASRVGFVSEEDKKESTAKNQHADFGTPPMTGNVTYGDYSMVQPKNYNPPGRWPANLIHDGSQEVLDLFPESNGGAAPKKSNIPTGKHYEGGWGPVQNEQRIEFGSGSAARFFYCPKASKKDRDDGCEGMEERARPTMGNGIGGQPNQQRENNRNFHPTVKPTDLMRYLCRLVTPPGGTVLDPFMGSGSTGRGAVLEGFSFIGVELSDEYAAIAKARIDAALRK